MSPRNEESGPAGSIDHAGTDAAGDAIAVRRAAMDLLARREHSRFELERKLLRRHPLGLIGEAIARLAEEGLQSDERFAESYVRQRVERGYGPLRIQRELQERGVEERVAANALKASEVDWAQVANQALEKKFGPLVEKPPQSMADKARVLRFAAYRGFSREHLPCLLD